LTKILLGTNNFGKVREFLTLASALPYTITIPSDEGIYIHVEEYGKSYHENAYIKAQAFSEASGLTTIADDSGLEVDALGGAPGLKSARYAGLDATDKDRVLYLLDKLKGIGWEKRTARFICAIVLVKPNGEPKYFDGVCEGKITLEPKGEAGFGYDPVFYIPAMGKTIAQLSPDQKNNISHRSIAAKQLLRHLRDYQSGA